MSSWRFCPDGYKVLADHGRLKLLEVSTDWEPHADKDSVPWGDTVGVFKQPPMTWLVCLRRVTMQRLRYWVLLGYGC